MPLELWCRHSISPCQRSWRKPRRLFTWMWTRSVVGGSSGGAEATCCFQFSWCARERVSTLTPEACSLSHSCGIVILRCGSSKKCIAPWRVLLCLPTLLSAEWIVPNTCMRRDFARAISTRASNFLGPVSRHRIYRVLEAFRKASRATQLGPSSCGQSCHLQWRLYSTPLSPRR